MCSTSACLGSSNLFGMERLHVMSLHYMSNSYVNYGCYRRRFCARIKRALPIKYCFQGGREIVRVTEAGGISLTDAQKLRGRMQFAEAQIHGRTGTRCLRALREVCCRKRTQFLDHEFLSLRLFANMLEMGKPRVITWDKRNPLVIFTDVCYE